ncbi:hypothetical protein [Cedecea colo]|uniref:Uncharacterized protein n=1 Tax=Cedecea colo TaxID=2552946 RepID=A0ABX0VLK3_9ENTR|nr:hypothetical protein [Cedecea colo]NIY47215.1 hypothetical protein [Cedecea colo]
MSEFQVQVFCRSVGVQQGTIGNIVDAGAAAGSYNLDMKDAATALGKGVGSLFTMNFKEAYRRISKGIAGIMGYRLLALSLPCAIQLL